MDDIRKNNQKLSEEKNILQGVSDRYDHVVRVLGLEAVDAAVQQDIKIKKRWKKNVEWSKCQREAFTKD